MKKVTPGARFYVNVGNFLHAGAGAWPSAQQSQQIPQSLQTNARKEVRSIVLISNSTII